MRRILTILIGAWMASCQTVIEMDIDETENRLSVYGFLDPASEATFKVDASKGILEPGYPEAVDNASIRIESDGGLVYNVTESKIIFDPNKFDLAPLYYAGFNPIPGEGYTVYASANGYESIVARTQIPYQVNITKVDTGRRTFNGYEEAFLNVSFRDDPSEANYYLIKVSLAANLPVLVDTDSVAFVSRVQDAYAYAADESLLGGSYGNLIFSDELFNGREYTAGLLFYNWLDVSEEIDSQYVDSIQVFVITQLISLSEEAYKFWSSYYKQLGASGDPFAQPVQVYTNVESGFGCVGGQATTIDTVVVTTDLVRLSNYNDYIMYEDY